MMKYTVPIRINVESNIEIAIFQYTLAGKQSKRKDNKKRLQRFCNYCINELIESLLFVHISIFCTLLLLLPGSPWQRWRNRLFWTSWTRRTYHCSFIPLPHHLHHAWTL